MVWLVGIHETVLHIGIMKIWTPFLVQNVCLQNFECTGIKYVAPPQKKVYKVACNKIQTHFGSMQ